MLQGIGHREVQPDTGTADSKLFKAMKHISKIHVQLNMCQ